MPGRQLSLFSLQQQTWQRQDHGWAGAAELPSTRGTFFCRAAVMQKTEVDAQSNIVLEWYWLELE